MNSYTYAPARALVRARAHSRERARAFAHTRACMPRNSSIRIRNSPGGARKLPAEPFWKLAW
eukprot:2657222-Karenia_brevis.AAC.1